MSKMSLLSSSSLSLFSCLPFFFLSYMFSHPVSLFPSFFLPTFLPCHLPFLKSISGNRASVLKSLKESNIGAHLTCLGIWPWAAHSFHLDLSFLTFKVGFIIHSLFHQVSYCEDQMKWHIREEHTLGVEKHRALYLPLDLLPFSLTLLSSIPFPVLFTSVLVLLPSFHFP